MLPLPISKQYMKKTGSRDKSYPARKRINSVVLINHRQSVARWNKTIEKVIWCYRWFIVDHITSYHHVKDHLTTLFCENSIQFYLYNAKLQQQFPHGDLYYKVKTQQLYREIREKSRQSDDPLWASALWEGGKERHHFNRKSQKLIITNDLNTELCINT